MSNAIRAACAAAMIPCLFSPALAQPAPPADPLAHIAPHEREAYVRQLVAKQQASAAQAEAAADVTGPVLTGFVAGSALKVNNAVAPFKIKVNATDDLSGVQGMYFYATGPSGQTLSAYANPGFPGKTVAVTSGVNLSESRVLEPGTWKFTWGHAYDVAGNYSYFDEAALDALGNTTFTVVNNTGYDLVGPQLVSGQIITPEVSLSALVPGTNDKHRWAGAKLTLSDSGTTATAGIESASLHLCKVADPGKCLYLYGWNYASGQASLTMTLGTEVSAANGHSTGTYEIKNAYLYDQAGNNTYLTSTKFGGSTNFSTLFPTTKIKITP